MLRYTKHQWEIVFRSATLVRDIEPKSNSSFLDAPSISDIQHFMVEEHVLTDVTGLVASVGCLRVNMGGYQTLKFILIDENDYLIECTASGSIAGRYSELWPGSGNITRICLLRFWRIEQRPLYSTDGTTNDMILRSFPGCFEFIFNPVVPEAAEFRDRFQTMADQGSIVD
ncbi:unnamed protein product [Microthlaspi erraticum]|uniref:DUF223 domain-containing protein n=1 Tax=Microthlaspi erraticum TaxID=1685480 RepID=A0A6D2JAZ5_9BRAS|nr:unnamed protein product [Microthlaspi erraticum]